MRVGDIIESAIWLDGRETEAQHREHQDLIKFNIEKLCEQEGFIHGPVKWIEKRPGDDRVPEVPKHVEKAANEHGYFDRVKLLVAEAKIIDIRRAEDPRGSFIANLDKKDLIRLRAITRKAWAKKSSEGLTDPQVDEIIEEIGVDAALDTLRVYH